jgi:hypothetical protein
MSLESGGRKMKTLIALCVTGSLAALPLAATEDAGSKGTAEGKSVTVSGCVQEEAARAGSFLLVRTDIKASPGAGQKKDEELMYRLVASGTTDIKAHLGHTVRISGTVTPSASRAQIGEPGAEKVPAASPAVPPELKIQSVQHVADGCEPMPR